jgi:hypothetical protein
VKITHGLGFEHKKSSGKQVSDIIIDAGRTVGSKKIHIDLHNGR